MSERSETGGLPQADPHDVGMDPARLGEVEAMMVSAVETGVFPGGVLAVLRSGRVALARAFGRLTYSSESAPVSLDTVYDLASLTKVVVTTTASMQLLEAGSLELDAPVARYLPAFGADDPGKRVVTVRDLLTHCSGMPPVFPGHFPAYAASIGLDRERGEIVRAAMRMPLEYEPRTRVAYSDIGAITLGAVVEGVGGARLDVLAKRRILEPLGLAATRYRPPVERWPSIAPTEDDPWRGRVVQGEVHDECAWAMGGVSAHAGLFGSAPDLVRFGQAMLCGGALDDRRIAQADTVRLFTARDRRIPGSDRALGWQVASPDNSAGPDLSPRAFGHTGFTGTSLWIDPDRELVIVLLTNRVHPRRENTRIIAFRPSLHSLITGSIVE